MSPALPVSRPSETRIAPSVVIVGAGLAGIAAASALSRSGMRVTLLESRLHLGGRATSYLDQETGALIDNCQHVSMGCCTQLRHLCRTLGIGDAFQTERTLYFISPQGRRTPFYADLLPAPFHLSRSFWRLPYLSVLEKISFARGVRKLARATANELSGLSFLDWLKSQGQPERVIRDAWEVVLVSALSESLDRVDAAYARKVFCDGFLKNRDGWLVEIPKIGLQELYSTRVLTALQQTGVDIQCQARCAALSCEAETLSAITLRDGREMRADEFIFAVPHHQLEPLLDEHSQLKSLQDQIRKIETAPITSVHLWFDRAIMALPHAVLVNRLGQWVFSRGECETPGGKGYLYQVVISASRQLHGVPPAESIERVRQELADIWPAAAQASLLHSRVVTERRAVFSALPGVDAFRPSQQTVVKNLQIAGDWTQTGWPATMEGAVRSGYLAAANLLERYSLPPLELPEDLPATPLARLFFGKEFSRRDTNLGACRE